MLQSLHVKNLALIDDVEIDFSKGLNILTGETGAGKSIIIDAVNFALGGKMQKDVVRDDAKYALSELVFSVEDEAIIEELNKKDIVVEDGEVILQRRIANGKSVCKCNGESVPVALVKDIAALLIDVHGQHEHQSLLYKKNHKRMLDEFCGEDFKSKLCQLAQNYDEYKKVFKECEEATMASGNRQQDIAYASFVINEISSANLIVGEDDKLEKEFARMNNARKIAENIASVQKAMSSDDQGAGSIISYAVSTMKQVAGIDDEAKNLYELISQTEDLVSDFNRALYDYEQSLEFEAEEFSRVQDRLDEINRLKSKYGQTIELILQKRDEQEAIIEKLSNFDEYLRGLEEKKKKCFNMLLGQCEVISNIRKEEGKVLEKDIVAALNNLNFLDARFEIVVNPVLDKMSADGYDEVEFMISTNPGESLKPLTQVASGGELSRIMLALKSVLAKRDAIGTLIFDEIDTGISGKTAQRVADRMSQIAHNSQVICITHLPQIASHASSHFLIEKAVEDGHTSTSVSKLDYDGSVKELARMLSGEEITEAVLNNAAEMKKESQLKLEDI